MRKVAPQEASNQRYDDLRRASNYYVLLHLLSVGGFDQASGYWVMDWKGLLKHYRARLKGGPQVG